MANRVNYVARYQREDVNPFLNDFKNQEIKTVVKALTEKQAKIRNTLAEEATPKGYEFVDCEME